MNKNTFNYIMSGCGFTRISFEEGQNDSGCLEYIKNCFDTLNTEDHKFSLLFNSFTEGGFGKKFQSYRDSVSEIMADSGGLQIITQGLKITDELKNEVYLNQSKWSDTSLSFDEIPLKLTGDTSARLDLTQRFFDPSILESCARKTGRNVTEQIELFMEEKTNAKPILILQGNCYDSYMKWADYILDEIPWQYHRYIRGIAMSTASFGFGFLEDIRRGFYFTQLPINSQRLHLLAVGSINRLLPSIIFSQSGLYKDLEISYDSTTHSSSIQSGKIFLGKKIYKFPKTFDHKVHGRIHNELMNSPFKFDLTVEEMFEILNTPSLVWKKKHGTRHKYIKTQIGLTCLSINEFMKFIDQTIKDRKHIFNLSRSVKLKNIYESLYTIKNKDDFEYWERHFAKYVNSKKIQPLKPKNNLDDLF